MNYFTFCKTFTRTKKIKKECCWIKVYRYLLINLSTMLDSAQGHSQQYNYGTT